MKKVILKDGYSLVDRSFNPYATGNIVTYTLHRYVEDKGDYRDVVNLNKDLVLGYVRNTLYLTFEGFSVLVDAAPEAFTLPGDN